MAVDTLIHRINDYASRADPYPLYAELRRHRVARQDDGAYLVGTYHEIQALLHDPRISSDGRNRIPPERIEPEDDLPPSFITLDDPEHDRLRRIAMRPFGPPHTPGRIDSLVGEMAGVARDLLTGLQGRDVVDIVDDFAYPLPVTMICRLLGVPREDETRFRAWSEAIIASFDPTPGEDPAVRERAGLEARGAMGQYLGDLADTRRGHPADDMLSAYVEDEGPDGRFTRPELMATGVLLLIAGHETTVNLITNGTLTLLRHPEWLERLRREPALMPRAVEELLRYEPPVQMLPLRTPLADVQVAGTTIPQGAPLTLVLASGSRDPVRFDDPDRFDPAREDNRHLGFGSGIHNCFGAPLARLETQVALTELLAHLGGARLVEDPPPYRRSPILRGPRHLPVALHG
ncbi:cytochrome P450 [Actinopolymorpha pittospori]